MEGLDYEVVLFGCLQTVISLDSDDVVNSLVIAVKLQVVLFGCLQTVISPQVIRF